MLHSTESHRVWSALRWRRVGANWQQVQTCFRHTVYTCACGCYIHSGMSHASFSHMSQPSSQTRFFNIWCSCDVLSSASAGYQVSLFFKSSDLVFTLSLLHQLFRDCLHTSLSLRIHHAWIHSCSHRCSSTWVCNMHSRTELTWERLNIACSLS